MGFAGNVEPQYIMPSVIAANDLKAAGTGVGKAASEKTGVEDLDFFIGDAALEEKIRTTYQVYYPVKHGQVENWTLMERVWEHCIFKYLRAEPEDHYFLLVRRARKKKQTPTAPSKTIA